MRRNFNRSKLVHLLGDADADVGAAEPGRQDIAERLAAWVGVFDSVTLHAAHQSIRGVAAASRAEARSARTLAMGEQLHRVRTVLTQSITTMDAAPAGDRRSRQATVAAEPVAASKADFAPFRQRYLDQQRNMDLMIGPLRANLREALAAASPELRQLAALDAVWEQILAPRERRLLPTLPGFLERRFQQLCAAHAQDDPAEARGPGGWLDGFGQSLQQVLLAELETRLEPLLGLLEALNGGADRAHGEPRPIDNEAEKYQ